MALPLWYTSGRTAAGDDAWKEDTLKKKIQIVVGFLLGIFLVWYLFRDIDLYKVGKHFANANWGWLFAAFVAIFLSFFTRTQRWGFIVRTAKPVSFGTLFNATQIGFLANYSLPARAGEVIRALVLSRRAQIPFSKCFAFVALDRVTDLFGLMATLLMTILFYHPTGTVILPEGMILPEFAKPLLEADKIRSGAELTGLALSVLIAGFVLLYVKQAFAVRTCRAVVGVFSEKLANKACEMLSHFAEGMHVFRSFRDMAQSIFWSLATWALAAVSFYFIFAAFGLNAPWYAMFVVLAVLAIAISLPGAPGFIGQYHIGVMLPLYMLVPGIPQDTAGAVAIMGHLLNLLGVVIVGIYALQSEHVGLLALQHEGEEVIEQIQEDAADA